MKYSFRHDPARRPSPKEKVLPITGHLNSTQGLVYVVQCVQSVNPDFPAWSSVYYWALGPVADPFKKHAIGKKDLPSFLDLGVAQKCAAAINHEGCFRARVIARYEAVHEILMA